MNTYSKLFVTFVTLVFASTASSSELILMPAWQSETVFEQPESVVLSPDKQSFFVSNVNGSPDKIDGNGYISQMSLTGEVIEQHWLDGLDAPKGMAISGNNLYVADIKQLVVIDIAKKEIVQRYLAPYAKFLNDVAADKDGNVYVSDMMTNTIHRLMKGSFTVWLRNDQLEAPNGLLVEGGNLIVGSWGNMTDGFVTAIPGHLKTIDIKTKKISSLGDQTPVGNLDGVEPDGEGNYYVTDWMDGRLIHIQPSGISKTLLKLAQGAADHTVMLDQGLVIIPMMLGGNVLAYKIKISQ
jgi:DNA-binding beta-propeller fold protein YncE